MIKTCDLTACWGSLYVSGWTFDNTQPFFMQVTNPLLFPICSVLYQFQANALLATKVIRPVKVLFVPVYKEM